MGSMRRPLDPSRAVPGADRGTSGGLKLARREPYENAQRTLGAVSPGYGVGPWGAKRGESPLSGGDAEQNHDQAKQE